MSSVIRLLKVPSSKLKEKGFNYRIGRKKANILGYMIALGESQVIDWLYEERGYSSFSEADKEVQEIKKEIASIKNDKELTKEDRTKEVDTRLQQIDDLLFVDELLQIEFSGRKDLDTIMKKHNGIVTVNGIKYKYLVSKGSDTLTYIKEDLYVKISTRLNAGRDLEVPLQPAKLSAYKSLAFTNSEQVTAPKNVIVIPDCEVRFEEDYLWVGATEDSIKRKREIVKRNICDGCGFISPELAEQWSRDLRKEEKIASAFQVRNLWCKGILVPVDYKKYCIEHDTYMITDVWGHERNILMADIILTESMVKVHKGYKSLEDWLKASHDYGYVWRVGKVAKPDKFGNSNYQQILPMNLTEDDCRDFIQPQIELMRKITGEDATASFTSLFLNGTNHTERSIRRMFNSEDVEYTLSSALMIEPQLLTDKFVARKIQSNLKGQRNEMRYGHCMVESNYQIITCDPIQLMQHMCGVENPKGVLKKGEIYSKKHMTQDIKECIAFRAPMLIENNICKVSIAQIDEEYSEYFKYLDNIYCCNGQDLMNESLCGFDLDGDTLQLLHNDTIMRAYDNLPQEAHLPVICDSIGAKPTVIKDDNVLIQNARIMLGNSIPEIGAVINRFSKVYVTRSKFDRNSEEYKVLTKRLLCAQCISQSTIDAKKSAEFFETPKHWYNESHIEFLPPSEQEFNAPLVASSNPYFFMHNDDSMKSKYNTWLNNVNVRTIAHWGITLDELKEMPKTILTEEQQKFLEFVDKACPVCLEDKSTMKTFTDVVEKELKEVRASVSKKVVDNRDLLKFKDVTYDEETYKAVLREYYKYKNSRVDDSKQIYVNGLYDEEEVYLQQKKVKQEREKEKIKLHTNILALCDDVQIATNILIDISYDDDTNIALCWELFGSEIINNLLERHDYKVNVVESDEKGDIVYKGKRYTSKIIDIREVEDLDDEFDSDVM